MPDRKSTHTNETSFFREGETVSVVTLQKGTDFLDYLVPEGGVELGSFVKVPLRNKIILGIVWSKERSTKTTYDKKEISKVLNLPSLTDDVRNFLKRCSEYNIFSLNTALRLCVSPNLNLENSDSESFYEIGIQETKRLTPERKRVLDSLSIIGQAPISKTDLIKVSKVSESVIRNMEKRNIIRKISVERTNDFAKIQPSFSKTLSDSQKHVSDDLRLKVKSESYSTTLLKGVTGSGKTEVYMDAIAEAILLGHQVLVLFPEIGLSTTFAERFQKRFKCGFAEWHSEISVKQKRNILRAVLDGSLKLVFGARSAVFLPFNNLGLIIVDEEHDSSYKQEENIRYHARDMAVLKGSYSQAPVILVSATPSLETWVNALEMKYEGKSLPKRFGNALLPNVTLVDMRQKSSKEHQWLSKEIVKKIECNMKKKQQSLLFLNRRGYSPLIMCKHCFHVLTCRNCDAKLADHKLHQALLCHLCGSRYELPKTCPSCHKNFCHISIGPGIERIEEEIRSIFPTAVIELLSSDHYNESENLKDCFKRIACGKVDIIIGTQMISKGHNFPLLSFVGIIDVDLALKGGDIRAAENTFQLLRQVIGRAGRHEIAGEAYVQTYFPDDTVMKTLCMANDDEFMFFQKKLRELAKVPPFGRMVALIVSGSVRDNSMDYAQRLVKKMFALKKYNVEIYGPADARVSKIRKKFRVRILLKASKFLPIQPLVKNILLDTRPPRGVRVTIDVDPITFH